MEAVMKNHHFTFRKVTPVADMQGKLWEMEHEKSGAKLVWLERPDENMTFGIAFKTIPTDSTGVFHILEHSVLCGSDRYPVKEPFVELLKSSLQTFLNAMTFPDKTVYPVSSRNKQDFLNLISIYMDAVLHPIAVRDSKIFRQEGWRFEMTDGEQPVYQGVVYNEMKGAYSDVRSVLEQTMMDSLFQDTCYRHDSGGDPECIPDLTYEQFVESHAKYYHPSNGLIVLDGAVDLDACLAFLDNCLDGYTRQKMEFPIAWQESLPYQEIQSSFEIGDNEGPVGRTIVSWGKIACSFSDMQTMYGLNILSDYLCGGSEGPLKRAVLAAGLGADMTMRLHDGMQQAWLGWEVWNTDADKVPTVKQTVRDTLAKLAAEGLDKERLEACFSTLAFNLQNRDGMGFPRGIMETLTILEPWLYGGDPALGLSFGKVLDGVKAKIPEGWFEELIRTYLLDDMSGVLVTLVPSQSLGQKRLEKESKKVSDAWNAMNATEKECAKADCEAIRIWQQTPDSPEALETIPMLKLDDLSGDPKPLPMMKETVEGAAVLRHNVDSSLSFINLYFNASDVGAEELPALSLLCSLLGKLATKNYSSAKLQTLVKQKIGSLKFSTEVYGKGTDKHKVFLAVRSVILQENLSEAVTLLREILTQTCFEDTRLLSDILRQTQNNNQMSLISAGNRYAASRVSARETSAGAAKEMLSGCAYISWVNQQCDSCELQTLMTGLKALTDRLITRERATVSISQNAEVVLDAVVQSIPAAGEVPDVYGSVPVLDKCREGILIPAGVAYAAKGANIGAFSGHTFVLANLLSYAHLWNTVRVQGGAYGAGFFGTDNGDVTYYSYRDPNPGRSIGCFDASAKFVQDFSQSGVQLDKFILGAMSEADPLLGAAAKMQLAESRFFKGISYEDVCRIYAQLRETSWEDMNKLAQTLCTVAEKENSCIVGGKALLDACGEQLDAILEV